MRPDFSGQWRFDAGASRLEIARPDALLFTIDHREPSFRLERTLTFGGRSDTFALTLTIGAEPAALIRGDAILYPSLRWDSDDLVFLTRISRGAEESTNLVRYRLEEGGGTLLAEESFSGPAREYQNRWVFTRQEVRPD